MRKFEVKPFSNSYYIGKGTGDYMHRDGEIVPGATEYWPTREQAQAVLDKFQPKHVWVHGDVFTNCGGATWLYAIKNNIPDVICISGSEGDGTLEVQMSESVDTRFLFNINTVIEDKL